MADITKRLLSLSNETGYHILQRNGQRKYGPPPNWKGPAPKGTEIFVGKIPRDCYEDELVPVFSCVGQIYEMRLMMDFSGSNRGYCFVSYSTPSESYKAVRELNGYQIRPKKYLGVVKSVDNCRLFVGGIPKTKTRENIYEELSKYVDGIVDVILYNSSSDKSLNRGFAFIEFENHRAAAMARRVLIPGRIQVWENDLMVDWAEPEPDVDEDVMKEVKILYVRNLNADTKLATLQTIFENAINYQVERVKKIKDFAFVHFFRRDQAQMALDTLNNTMVDGCLIEVKWAKPVSNEFRLNKMRFSKYGCHGEVRALDLEDKFGQLNIGTSDTDLSLGFMEDGSRSSALTALCVPESYAPRVCVPAAQDVPTPTFVSQARVPAGVSQLALPQPCAIQRLDAICKKYNWSKPEYFYRKLSDCSSWLASVVLPAVGAPLFKVDRMLGPSHSHALGSPTSYLACVEAAQQLLLTMKKFCDQENQTQRVPAPYDSTVQFPSALPLRPFQQTMQTGLPYSLPVSDNPGLFSLHTWPPQCN